MISMEKYVECDGICDTLVNMVVERFMVNMLSLDSKISYTNLEITSYEEITKHAGHFHKFSTDICTFKRKCLYVTSNKILLEEKKIKYIRSLIHKLVVPLHYNSKNPECFFGRFVTENAYSETEKQFMDEIQQKFFDICNANVDDSLMIFNEVTPNTLIRNFRFHAFMNVKYDGLCHRVRDIINKIVHSELKYGDDITDLLSKNITKDFFQEANPDYILFFKCKGNRYFLNCDRQTNKHLFWFYLFNYLVFDFDDTKVKELFLVALHRLYCPIKP